MKSEVKSEYATDFCGIRRIYCGNCRREVDKRDCFCEHCGAELVWHGCINCAYIPDDQSASFCRHCGEGLTLVTQRFIQKNRVLQPYTEASHE